MLWGNCTGGYVLLSHQEGPVNHAVVGAKGVASLLSYICDLNQGMDPDEFSESTKTDHLILISTKVITL